MLVRSKSGVRISVAAINHFGSHRLHMQPLKPHALAGRQIVAPNHPPGPLTHPPHPLPCQCSTGHLHAHLHQTSGSSLLRPVWKFVTVLACRLYTTYWHADSKCGACSAWAISQQLRLPLISAGSCRRFRHSASTRSCDRMGAGKQATNHCAPVSDRCSTAGRARPKAGQDGGTTCRSCCARGWRAAISPINVTRLQSRSRR